VFHSVACLKARLVAVPCTQCDPTEAPPSWDDALRRYARLECLVAQGRASMDQLNEDQKEDISDTKEGARLQPL
jgi:hypothetical protein